jgi:hypothetical protein
VEQGVEGSRERSTPSIVGMEARGGEESPSL